MEQINKVPEVEFAGRTWLIDLDGFQLIDKKDREHTLSFTDMRYSDLGYMFSYSTIGRSIVDKFAMQEEKFEHLIELGVLYEVYLPPLTTLDPEGLARRYNIDIKDVDYKHDADIMLDRNEILHGQRMPGELLDITVFASKAINEKSPIVIRTDEFMVRKFITARDMLLENPVIAEDLRQTTPEIFELMENLSDEFIEYANDFVKGQDSIQNEELLESVAFSFDYENFRMIQIDNPENIIEVSKMEDTGSGYEFLFDPKTKSIADPERSASDTIRIEIDYFTVLAPQRIADIHNVPVEFVNGKTDREFRRDLQELTQKREQNEMKSQTRKRTRGYKR